MGVQSGVGIERPHLEIRLSLVGGKALRPPSCPFWMVSHWPLIGPRDIHNSIYCPLPVGNFSPLPDLPAAPFCTASHFDIPARAARTRAGIVFFPWEAEEQEPRSAIASSSISIWPTCAIRSSHFRRLAGTLLVLLWDIIMATMAVSASSVTAAPIREFQGLKASTSFSKVQSVVRHSSLVTSRLFMSSSQNNFGAQGCGRMSILLHVHENCYVSLLG